jgi:cobalt-zinc-cadmium resistance protein CzcA
VPAGEIEWAVELDGRADSAFDLARTVVAEHEGVPILLSDVAEVVESGAFRRGVARHRGAEVVHVRVVRQVGADTVHVASGMREALGELVPPPGIRVSVTYDQAELVDGALGGVGRAVGIGAIFVVLVIMLLLGDVRAALVVALSIPISVALAVAILGRFGGGLNTMTLGGLAIAVGILVDASIIVVENAAHRLKDAHGSIPKVEVVTKAAAEMSRPIVFATLVVIAVFVPLFGMAGVEGRMYRALAMSVISAMGASLFVALGAIPAITARALSTAHTAGGKSLVVRVIERGYAPVLAFALARPRVVQVLAAAITVPAIIAGASVGSDFVPHLDEGYLMLETGVAPEASLETADRLIQAVEEQAAGFDQVANVTRRLGRGERTEDPMPHTNADILVELRPDRTMNDEEIAEVLRERVSLAPGTQVLFTTPLQMRIDEGLGGSPADLQVRVFGTDLDQLSVLANMLRDRMRHVRGLADVRTDVAGQSPELAVRLDRVAMSRAGVTPGAVTDAVRVATVGEDVGVVFRGSRRIDVMVRLDAPGSIDPEELRILPIETPEGVRLPLTRLARITSTVGPSIVRREAGQRRVGIEASVVGRDLGSAADEVRALVARAVREDFPEGTFAQVGGRIETQDAANRALLIAIILAVALVLVLVYVALGSLAETVMILGTLPSALVGGIAALLIAGETWNVSSLVGLLGLFGIAVQNGLVLVSQARGLETHGLRYDEAVKEASLGRVRPKLMTASTAMLGLLPLVVLRLRGVELERPLAIVMIGGLVTSTLFTLVVLPTFLVDLGRFRARRKETP